jgi:hypothetical protein
MMWKDLWGSLGSPLQGCVSTREQNQSEDLYADAGCDKGGPLRKCGQHDKGREDEEPAGE